MHDCIDDIHFDNYTATIKIKSSKVNGKTSRHNYDQVMKYVCEQLKKAKKQKVDRIPNFGFPDMNCHYKNYDNNLGTVIENNLSIAFSMEPVVENFINYNQYYAIGDGRKVKEAL